MREADRQWVWVSTPIQESRIGRVTGGYTRLRRVRLNVQYMDNETEQKTFGKITNQTLVLRSQTLPDIQNKDALYLSEPSAIGNFTVGGTVYEDYGPGEYEVLSVIPLRMGAASARNPTVITARAKGGKT